MHNGMDSIKKIAVLPHHVVMLPAGC